MLRPREIRPNGVYLPRATTHMHYQSNVPDAPPATKNTELISTGFASPEGDVPLEVVETEHESLLSTRLSRSILAILARATDNSSSPYPTFRFNTGLPAAGSLEVRFFLTSA